jgi:hypothetical protein
VSIPTTRTILQNQIKTQRASGAVSSAFGGDLPGISGGIWVAPLEEAAWLLSSLLDAHRSSRVDEHMVGYVNGTDAIPARVCRSV